MTKISQYKPLDILAGVQPVTDEAEASTPHWTYAEKIRFLNGLPEKIGGFTSILLDNGETIKGKARSIFSTRFTNRIQTLIGTNLKLYNVTGSTLTNITPVSTSSIAAANSLDTMYGTLVSNPIATQNGSNTLTVSDAQASRFKVGDTIILSGATGGNGILAAALNTTHVIRSIGTGNYTVRISTNATGTGSIGGAAVNRSSGIIKVTSAGHGNSNGDRVKISGAANTGGILAADINKEFPIRNVATNSYDIVTTGYATSSVTSGGGASTVYYEEIPVGAADESFGEGYGVGLYGVGLYGVSKVSSTGRVLPRIWFFDRFGDTVIMTPGNQTGLYQWDGSTSLAPTLVPGAPTAINYAFVSNNILVTLGSGNVGNKIKTSDQGDITNWTASTDNQVFEDDVEGADRFTSHLSVVSNNLLFTETQVYTFRYIGKNAGVWEIKPLDKNIGIIAPMARVTVNGIGYWMGQDNFYMWRGGTVDVMPSNSGKRSTMLKYVFDNINRAQKSKCFAWYNRQFNEIWFHYPSENSNEPDRVARFSILEGSWVPDTFDRTAAEYPVINLFNPQLISSSSVLYRHESGTDADGSPLPWVLRGPRRMAYKNLLLETKLIPASIQTGNINLNVKAFEYPVTQTPLYDNDYTLTPETDNQPCLVGGRLLQYEFSGSELGQKWRMGLWYEDIQETGSSGNR